MNILYITHTSRGGGASIAIANIIRGVKKCGHSIYVLTNGEEGELIDMLKDEDVPIFVHRYFMTIYPLDKNPLKFFYGFLLHIFWWISTKIFIGKIIDKFSIDLVHTNVGPLNLALSVCRRKGIPHVWHHREFFDKFSPSSFFPSNHSFYKRIQSEGNYNICITRQVLEYCKLSQNFYNRIIYDGVFMESDLPKYFINDKENYFVFVGRVEPNKGLDDLLISFGQFYKSHRDYSLKILGSYSKNSQYFNKCIDIVKKEGLLDCVHFLGYLKDAKNYIAKAKALIVPSHFEGFGFVTVEAMIYKTLVIGRDTSGTKEQFDIGLERTGNEIGIRFIDNGGLLSAMIKAAEIDNTSMIERAFDVVSKMYSIEKNIKKINELYLDCIKH